MWIFFLFSYFCHILCYNASQCIIYYFYDNFFFFCFILSFLSFLSFLSHIIQKLLFSCERKWKRKIYFMGKWWEKIKLIMISKMILLICKRLVSILKLKFLEWENFSHQKWFFFKQNVTAQIDFKSHHLWNFKFYANQSPKWYAKKMIKKIVFKIIIWHFEEKKNWILRLFHFAMLNTSLNVW